MAESDRVQRYRTMQEGYHPEGPGAPDYDAAEDEGYEQWEQAYTEGDDGSIQEAYLLDPDTGMTEEDLLFVENAFSPSMYGSPTPKDGLQTPDVAGYELEDDDATTDFNEAIDAGKIYYPPDDPPIHPSPRLRDADVGTGFAESADDVLDPEEYEDYFGDSDAEIEARVRETLRLHASTSHLPITVTVRNGVATLRGRVQDLDDIIAAEDLASEIDGVEEVRDQLEID